MTAAAAPKASRQLTDVERTAVQTCLARHLSAAALAARGAQPLFDAWCDKLLLEAGGQDLAGPDQKWLHSSAPMAAGSLELMAVGALAIGCRLCCAAPMGTALAQSLAGGSCGACF
jgi:hypothetical protein